MEPSIPGGICSVECLQTLPFVGSRIVPVEEEVPLDYNYFNVIGKFQKFPLMKNKKKRDPPYRDWETPKFVIWMLG